MCSLLHLEVLFKDCRLDTSMLQSYGCEFVVFTSVSCFLVCIYAYARLFVPAVQKATKGGFINGTVV